MADVASGSVRGCHVTGCRNPGMTDGHGVAATNPDELGTGVLSVSVRDNTFDNNRYSIHLFGDIYPLAGHGVLRLDVSVERNTVTGLGLMTGTTQHGMIVHSDAGGSIADNLVTDHVNQAAGFEASGILIGLPLIPGLINGSGAQHVTAVGNTVLGCREGIVVLASHGMQIVNNTIVGPGSNFAGADGVAVSGVGNHIVNNRISAVDLGVSVIGTNLFGGAFGIGTDTRIIANRLTDVATPFLDNPGATGTVLKANKITP